MISKIVSFFIFLLSFPFVMASPIKVITTTPEVSWLVKSIGQDKVVTDTLTSGQTDLHFMEARIDYILKIKKADILCYTGLGLELGWLPKVVQRAGNSNVMPGHIGDCNLGSIIKALDIPNTPVDRSMGDVHPQGNPHYTNDPLMMKKAAKVVAMALKKASPSNNVFFEKNLKKVQKKLSEIHQNIYQKLKPIKNRKIISYHSEFSYWLKTYDFHNQGMLEDKPGLPPSARRIADVSIKSLKNKVAAILYTGFNPYDVIKNFSRSTKIKMIEFQAHASSSDIGSYEAWQNQMANKVLNELTP